MQETDVWMIVAMNPGTQIGNEQAAEIMTHLQEKNHHILVTMEGIIVIQTGTDKKHTLTIKIVGGTMKFLKTSFKDNKDTFRKIQTYKRLSPLEHSLPRIPWGCAPEAKSVDKSRQ